MTTHDEIMELLGVYALDAVDPDERALVERHLAECPRCAAEVAEHREVAAMMAYSGAPAPEGLWSRIVESLEEPPPELDLPVGRARALPPLAAPPVDELAERRARRRPWLAGAAAAAALAVGLAGGVVLAGDDATTDDGTELASIEEVARRVLNDPDATRVPLESLEDESLTATAAVEDDGSGYLIGTSLPALGEDETYQLWGVRDEIVVSLGVLGHSPGVVAFHFDPGTDALVITKEVQGGVPISDNPALLVGNIA